MLYSACTGWFHEALHRREQQYMGVGDGVFASTGVVLAVKVIVPRWYKLSYKKGNRDRHACEGTELLPRE
jgi:hypothetical protein